MAIEWVRYFFIFIWRLWDNIRLLYHIWAFDSRSIILKSFYFICNWLLHIRIANYYNSVDHNWNNFHERSKMIKIFADGADKNGMMEMYRNPRIDGFTTNPTLMRKAGITDYVAFAKEILGAIPDKPISFEVFADDLEEMKRQALEIKTWGPNVYVKIPVMNTKRVSTAGLIRELSQSGVQLNITAILTLEQVTEVADALQGGTSAFVSVFAGRIADTGVDPIPLMKTALDRLKPFQMLNYFGLALERF